jgi:DNA-binding Lrp family transcriptional regulator
MTLKLWRKMLAELIRDPRRSDRQLGEAIGVSQPTASRIRGVVEGEGYVKEFTTIPNLPKVGYHVLAANFVKLDHNSRLPPLDASSFKGFSAGSDAVVSFRRGLGLGFDAVIVSVHRDFAACDRFRNLIRKSLAQQILDLDTFLVDLDDEKDSLPLTFSLLADKMQTGNPET